MKTVSLSRYLTVGLLLLGLGKALPVAAAAAPPAPDELLWYQDSQGLGQIQIDLAGPMELTAGGYRINVRIIQNCEIANGTGFEVLLPHLPILRSTGDEYLLMFALQDFSGVTRLFRGRLLRQMTPDGPRLRAEGDYELLGTAGDPGGWAADSASPGNLPAASDLAPGDSPS
jgi:hypothetical protein